MPSARRLITLGGAAFVGLAATALLATPASAHAAEITGKSECINGTYTIHWEISNNQLRSGSWDVTLTDVKPASTGLEGKKIKGGATLKFDQTGIPGDSTKATLSFTAKWVDNWPDPNNPHSGTVRLQGTCKPSPSPSPSSGGGGGGGGSPTPSSSSTAPALPVTGAQTGLYAGSAMVLLGAGAGLFFVARRRRIKFEA
jgi:LPXTG-motif cell wall-anchored protein